MDKDTNETNFDAMEGELKTRFGLLPKEIQDVITSSDYQTKLFEIAKKHKLTYEQLGALEFNTTLTLLGALNPTDYEKTVTNDIGKKPEEMSVIIAEVSEQVFKPIRSAMMESYSGATDDEDSTEVSSTEKDIMAQSGISLEKELAKTTPSAGTTESRNDMLAGIENPMRSTPRVLNEVVKPAPSTMPLTKPAAATIPVPRAPYAGGAPSMDAVKQPIPMTAKPAGDILAGKLGGTFSMPAKETDHSIKNVGTTTPAAPKSGDSYREPVE